jgi:hypothetical protein
VSLRFHSRNLGFLTSAYLLTSDHYLYTTSGMSVPENNGIAVAILSLASVELKIYCMLYAVRKFYSLLPVLSRHIGYWLSGGC